MQSRLKGLEMNPLALGGYYMLKEYFSLQRIKQLP
jgi:hypothetical protein